MRRCSFHLLFSVFISLASLPAFAESSACVKRNEAKAYPKPPAPLKKQKSVSIKKSKKREVSVVADPGTPVPKYTPFMWTGKKQRGWLELQAFDGQIVWMRSRDISLHLQCLKVRVEKSRMYEGPGNSFPKMGIASKGDSFLDLGGEDGWTQVQDADGKRSWINLDHTWKAGSRVRMSFSPDEN